MKKITLQSIDGKRTDLEKEALSLLMSPDASGVDEIIEQLKPRGQLKLASVEGSNAQPTPHPSASGKT